MSAEQVALVPGCTECDALWLPADLERCRCYIVDRDEVVFYWAECAERELGG